MHEAFPIFRNRGIGLRMDTFRVKTKKESDQSRTPFRGIESTHCQIAIFTGGRELALGAGFRFPDPDAGERDEEDGGGI